MIVRIGPAGEDIWVELTDVAAFRAHKRRGDGVVVIRRQASTTAHHPDCPHVSEDAFTRRLAGKGGYWWTNSLGAAQRRWPATKACGHPSDPLAGGTGGPEAMTRQVARTQPRDRASWSVDGPRRGLRAVRAYTDRYIGFSTRDPDLLELRRELQQRLARLAVRDGEVLHASFFGPAPDNADAENLLLYNIDQDATCFAAARHGVRFERSCVTPPQAPRRFAYVYRPAPSRGTFSLWQPGALIAEWSFTVNRPQRSWEVWWAARRAVLGRVSADAHAGAFCLTATVHPPGPAHDALASLAKPLLDGAVGALQIHADSGTLRETAELIASAIQQDPDVVGGVLSDAAHSGLSADHGPFRCQGSGRLALSPVDERCMAAELLLGPATMQQAWSVSCRVSVALPRPVRR